MQLQSLLLFPYTTLFRSRRSSAGHFRGSRDAGRSGSAAAEIDRKSTRLNSSHVASSYAVFCLKKKTMNDRAPLADLTQPTHASALAPRYRAIRAATEALAVPLSAEDCAIQSMPDASPVKWHLAHTSWFFETFILEPNLPGYRMHNPAFRFLYNSYYNAVGDRHPRPQRGLLSRPSLESVRAYRAHVDEAMAVIFAREATAAALGALIEL